MFSGATDPKHTEDVSFHLCFLSPRSPFLILRISLAIPSRIHFSRLPFAVFGLKCTSCGYLLIRNCLQNCHQARLAAPEQQQQQWSRQRHRLWNVGIYSWCASPSSSTSALRGSPSASRHACFIHLHAVSRVLRTPGRTPPAP